MSKGDTRTRKAAYLERVVKCFNDYSSILIVNADNVGSHQFHQTRITLRGKAVIVMGKNTMIRRCIRTLLPTKPELANLMPHIVGNIGMVFTNMDLRFIRDILLKDRKAAPARAGIVAPNDVFVPPQNTGMGPEKTSFFQALGISTKIAKGTIEILSEQHLVKSGEKVGASEAALLNMLGMSPFTYGLTLVQLYQDGSAFAPHVLEITDDVLLKSMSEVITKIAAISLGLKFATKPAVIHSLINGYKNVLAVAVATDYSFPLAEKAKAYLANPSAFAAAPAAAAPAAAAAAPAKGKKEEKVEEKEESDADMGMGLFD